MARAGHRRPSRCGAPSDVGFYVRREGVDQGAAGTKARNVGADASGVKAASPRKTWSEVRRLAVTSQTGRLRSTLPFLRILLNLLPGRLAQLVERLLYTQDVGGSSPSPPTSARNYACPDCSLNCLARAIRYSASITASSSKQLLRMSIGLWLSWSNKS